METHRVEGDDGDKRMRERGGEGRSAGFLLSSRSL